MTKITRLFDFPYYQLEKNNLPNCLVTKYDGQWISTSTQEYLDKSNAVSRALIRLGIQKNDKIAIISSTNRTEWNIMDIGSLQVGAQTVPIYPTIAAEDYEYILNHSESKYCFVSDDVVYEKLMAVKHNIPLLQEVYCFNEIGGCKNWKELLELGADKSNQDVVEDRKNNVKPEELATIIYTSGTTGKPKGVMLSHNNIVSNVLDSSPRIPFNEGTSVALSFLPICHIFERVILYIYQYYSVSIYFAESIEKLSDNIKEVKPNVFSVVPRLLEKVYDKIIAKGEELIAEPQAQVMLSELNNTFLKLEPRFVYDGYVVDGPFEEVTKQTSGDKTISIVRHKQKEEELVEFLRSLHEKFTNQSNGFFYLNFAEAQKKGWFLKVYHKLLEMNIDLLGIDLMKHFRYSPHIAETVISKQEVEGNWICVAMTVKFGIEAIPLNYLQKSLMNGQKAVMLKDGSLGVLGEEWLRQYAGMVKHSRVNGDQLQVPRWLAMSLDATDDNALQLTQVLMHPIAAKAEYAHRAWVNYWKAP